MIKLKEKGNKNSNLVFPSMPKTISVSSNTNYQSYSIISKGTIKIPRGTEGKQISWSGEFFGKAKKKEAVVLKNKWKSPQSCRKVMEKWQQNNTILTLMITETGINMDVTIESFDTEDCGAYGNIKYSISFEQADPLKIYTTKSKTAQKTSKKKQTKARPSAKNKKTYVVKKATTVWQVSKEIFGDSGAGWKQMYELNKQVIEVVALANGLKNSDLGRYLFTGIQLVLPEE